MTAKRDLMRGGLAILLLLSFQLCLAALFKFQVPESNRDMVIYMLGQLSGMVTTALAFYFATSKSSSDKNAVMTAMADAPKDVHINNTAADPVPTTEGDDP